ncbi:hypothetical protein NCWK1_0295 [Nostoc cycadae WK-1]|uniref:Uncharacterized protein n=1 Tax=Nostoc cycadae WK-1 TaxID=1861711 RepID=A0A2H6LBM9_9NOSO|nr:hypothetical protein NCWK1_0295 [Nostoc cycadae WK-1]
MRSCKAALRKNESFPGECRSFLYSFVENDADISPEKLVARHQKLSRLIDIGIFNQGQFNIKDT